MVITWDPPRHLPPRGYWVKVPSQEIDTNVINTTYITSIATGVGRYDVEVWPLSRHFVPIVVGHVMTLKGETAGVTMGRGGGGGRGLIPGNHTHYP